MTPINVRGRIVSVERTTDNSTRHGGKRKGQKMELAKKTATGYRITRNTILGWGYEHTKTGGNYFTEPSFVGTARQIRADQQSDRVYRSFGCNRVVKFFAKTPSGYIQIDAEVIDNLLLRVPAEDSRFSTKEIWYCSYIDVDENGNVE